jgi:parvulin-like peptidyl-prolyl isomerase
MMMSKLTKVLETVQCIEEKQNQYERFMMESQNETQKNNKDMIDRTVLIEEKLEDRKTDI